MYAFLIGLLLVLVSAAPLHAQAFAELKNSLVDYSKVDVEPRMPCEQLATAFKNKDIVKLETRSVAAAGTTPAHCRVSGVLSPEIGFEVNLPAKWNQRLYMIGNGGLAGEQPDDAGRASQRVTALANGFVMVSTDTGHNASKGAPGTFVLDNPQKAIDYAYRAVHLTATTAKSIANAYYSKPVAHAYWNSCSNGGRQGLIEAQRYPEDFDGIVANAPWADQTGFTIGAIWNQRAIAEAPLSQAKLSLVAERVMAKCDRIDGLVDGLIDDPRKCDFDPARDIPVCPANASSAQCLTSGEASTLKKIYGGVVSKGKPFFPGFMVGSEAFSPAPAAGGTSTSGWTNLIVPGATGGNPADFSLADATMKYLVFSPPKPEWDFKSFEFDRDVTLLDRWGQLANAKNPDLSAFRKRGGKLIMTYGWADPILMPMMGVNYYERAVEKNGPQTTNFFRLFMIPGMSHCAGGIGPDQNDSVSAIVDWVEKGKAPASILAKKIVLGQVTRSRPLCPYPQVARYKGQGSIDDAANFSCVAP